MALKVDILEVAAAMDVLAAAVRAVHVRIPVADMVDLSERAAAGRTGLPAHASIEVVTHCHGCCRPLRGVAARELHLDAREAELPAQLVGSRQAVRVGGSGLHCG